MKALMVMPPPPPPLMLELMLDASSASMVTAPVTLSVVAAPAAIVASRWAPTKASVTLPMVVSALATSIAKPPIPTTTALLVAFSVACAAMSSDAAPSVTDWPT